MITLPFAIALTASVQPAFDAALRAFERLGARPWAARANTELGISAARHTRPRAVTEQLTPQELQVAFAVAQGASNRAVAAALFLSPKTVEFHLRNIYRKLSIRSRTELVRVVISDSGSTAVRASAAETRHGHDRR